MLPSLRKFYGRRWRAKTRPRILARDGERCRKCGSAGPLDVAHLDGDSAHGDDANLAALCRPCHRRLDYRSWRTKARDTRAGQKDAARPLLAMAA